MLKHEFECYWHYSIILTWMYFSDVFEMIMLLFASNLLLSSYDQRIGAFSHIQAASQTRNMQHLCVQATQHTMNLSHFLSLKSINTDFCNLDSRYFHCFTYFTWKNRKALSCVEKSTKGVCRVKTRQAVLKVKRVILHRRCSSQRCGALCGI